MLLRVEEVAERLRVQPATVYRFIRDGVLPCVRFGRMVRIREADLETFGTSVPGSEVASERSPGSTGTCTCPREVS